MEGFMSVADAAKKFGISYATMMKRIKHGDISYKVASESAKRPTYLLKPEEVQAAYDKLHS